MEISEDRKNDIQEEKNMPVEPEIEGDRWNWFYVCGECHGYIDWKEKVCRHCGRVVDWDA